MIGNHNINAKQGMTDKNKKYEKEQQTNSTNKGDNDKVKNISTVDTTIKTPI